MPTLESVEFQRILLNAAVTIGSAILVLLIGRWLAGVARRSTIRVLQRAKASASVTHLSERAAFFGTLGTAVFIALVILGIPAAVLITIIAIAVIVAAVALRESLRDLAATVIFVVFEPFKVGDQIETNGIVGNVLEILPFNTILLTLDNRRVILPNGNIQNSNLYNYSAIDKIRLNIAVQISYTDDISKAKETLLAVAHADPRVLADPEAFVDVMDFGENGIQLILRVHCTPADYWGLRPSLNEKVKEEFDRQHLTIPFPQLSLHVEPKETPK